MNKAKRYTLTFTWDRDTFPKIGMEQYKDTTCSYQAETAFDLIVAAHRLEFKSLFT